MEHSNNTVSSGNQPQSIPRVELVEASDDSENDDSSYSSASAAMPLPLSSIGGKHKRFGFDGQGGDAFGEDSENSLHQRPPSVSGSSVGDTPLSKGAGGHGSSECSLASRSETTTTLHGVESDGDKVDTGQIDSLSSLQHTLHQHLQHSQQSQPQTQQQPLGSRQSDVAGAAVPSPQIFQGVVPMALLPSSMAGSPTKMSTSRRTSQTSLPSASPTSPSSSGFMVSKTSRMGGDQGKQLSVPPSPSGAGSPGNLFSPSSKGASGVLTPVAATTIVSPDSPASKHENSLSVSLTGKGRSRSASPHVGPTGRFQRRSPSNSGVELANDSLSAHHQTTTAASGSGVQTPNQLHLLQVHTQLAASASLHAGAGDVVHPASPLIPALNGEDSGDTGSQGGGGRSRSSSQMRRGSNGSGGGGSRRVSASLGTAPPFVLNNNQTQNQRSVMPPTDPTREAVDGMPRWGRQSGVDEADEEDPAAHGGIGIHNQTGAARHHSSDYVAGTEELLQELEDDLHDPEGDVLGGGNVRLLDWLHTFITEGYDYIRLEAFDRRRVRMSYKEDTVEGDFQRFLSSRVRLSISLWSVVLGICCVVGAVLASDAKRLDSSYDVEDEPASKLLLGVGAFFILGAIIDAFLYLRFGRKRVEKIPMVSATEAEDPPVEEDALGGVFSANASMSSRQDSVSVMNASSMVQSTKDGSEKPAMTQLVVLPPKLNGAKLSIIRSTLVCTMVVFCVVALHFVDVFLIERCETRAINNAEEKLVTLNQETAEADDADAVSNISSMINATNTQREEDIEFCKNRIFAWPHLLLFFPILVKYPRVFGSSVICIASFAGLLASRGYKEWDVDDGSFGVKITVQIVLSILALSIKGSQSADQHRSFETAAVLASAMTTVKRKKERFQVGATISLPLQLAPHLAKKNARLRSTFATVILLEATDVSSRVGVSIPAEVYNSVGQVSFALRKLAAFYSFFAPNAQRHHEDVATSGSVIGSPFELVNVDIEVIDIRGDLAVFTLNFLSATSHHALAGTFFAHEAVNMLFKEHRTVSRASVSSGELELNMNSSTGVKAEISGPGFHVCRSSMLHTNPKTVKVTPNTRAEYRRVAQQQTTNTATFLMTSGPRGCGDDGDTAATVRMQARRTSQQSGGNATLAHEIHAAMASVTQASNASLGGLPPVENDASVSSYGNLGASTASNSHAAVSTYGQLFGTVTDTFDDPFVLVDGTQIQTFVISDVIDGVLMKEKRRQYALKGAEFEELLVMLEVEDDDTGEEDPPSTHHHHPRKRESSINHPMSPLGGTDASIPRPDSPSQQPTVEASMISANVLSSSSSPGQAGVDDVDVAQTTQHQQKRQSAVVIEEPHHVQERSSSGADTNKRYSRESRNSSINLDPETVDMEMLGIGPQEMGDGRMAVGDLQPPLPQFQQGASQEGGNDDTNNNVGADEARMKSGRKRNKHALNVVGKTRNVLLSPHSASPLMEPSVIGGKLGVGDSRPTRTNNTSSSFLDASTTTGRLMSEVIGIGSSLISDQQRQRKQLLREQTKRIVATANTSSSRRNTFETVHHALLSASAGGQEMERRTQSRILADFMRKVGSRDGAIRLRRRSSAAAAIAQQQQQQNEQQPPQPMHFWHPEASGTISGSNTTGVQAPAAAVAHPATVAISSPQSLNSSMESSMSMSGASLFSSQGGSSTTKSFNSVSRLVRRRRGAGNGASGHAPLSGRGDGRCCTKVVTLIRSVSDGEFLLEKVEQQYQDYFLTEVQRPFAFATSFMALFLLVLFGIVQNETSGDVEWVVLALLLVLAVFFAVLGLISNVITSPVFAKIQTASRVVLPALFVCVFLTTGLARPSIIGNDPLYMLLLVTFLSLSGLLRFSHFALVLASLNGAFGCMYMINDGTFMYHKIGFMVVLYFAALTIHWAVEEDLRDEFAHTKLHDSILEDYVKEERVYKWLSRNAVPVLLPPSLQKPHTGPMCVVNLLFSTPGDMTGAVPFLTVDILPQLDMILTQTANNLLCPVSLVGDLITIAGPFKAKAQKDESSRTNSILGISKSASAAVSARRNKAAMQQCAKAISAATHTVARCVTDLPNACFAAAMTSGRCTTAVEWEHGTYQFVAVGTPFAVGRLLAWAAPPACALITGDCVDTGQQRLEAALQDNNLGVGNFEYWTLKGHEPIHVAPLIVGGGNNGFASTTMQDPQQQQMV